MNEFGFDKIEAYLNGEMTPEERSVFQQEISVNEELASVVALYRGVETEMRSQQKDQTSEASLKKTLEEAGMRHFNGEAAKNSETVSRKAGRIIKMPSRKILAVAASVLIIFALGGVLYFITENNRTKMVVKKDRPGVQTTGKDSGALVKSPDKQSKQENLPVVSIPIKDSLPPLREEALVRDKLPAVTPGTPKKRPADTLIQDSRYTSHKEEPLRALPADIFAKERSFTSTEEMEGMFVSNFHPDKVPDQKCGREEPYRYYAGGNFKKAIAGFEEEKTDFRGERECDRDVEEFYRRYYLALCYMAVYRVVEAIPELEMALKKSPNNLSTSKIQWYLALAFLKTGDGKRAEQYLTQVAGNNQAGGHKDEAVKLLGELVKHR